MSTNLRSLNRSNDSPAPMLRDLRDMYHFRGNTAKLYSPQKAAASSRSKSINQNQRFRRKIHERPILRNKHDSVGSIVFRDPNAKDKFRNLDELTDSEEEEVETSDQASLDMPTPKRQKLGTSNKAVDVVPKWCNPDPYTALPPPTEETGKGFDVIKLIRKAKISEHKDTEEASNPEDFISFDALDDDGLFAGPPSDAPTGPRAEMQKGNERLGKRKRGNSDVISRRQARLADRMDDDMVLQEWQASLSDNATPWLQNNELGDQAGIVLHKEILDFYEWVKPKEFETQVRTDVVNRLSVQLNRLAPGELKAFGSYAVDLYLPTGDMDLVYMLRWFRPGMIGRHGLPPPPNKQVLYDFANFLRKQGIARPDSVQLIPGAKVPIIKFVENKSGLKIDLSFNNDTGVVANDTVRKWKDAYPAMPIIVLVIKQYLMIRGLNDVSVGGLGGFSVICLVTSVIQHLPLLGSPPNLGQILLEFFNLYGNLLDRESVAIRLDPPGYVDKASYKRHLIKEEKPQRLTIIDPNRPENNVSGGTHEIQRVFDCLATAHDRLLSRLSVYSDELNTGEPFSFLRDLVGGNFAAYEIQRGILQDVYSTSNGRDAPAVILPAPAPINGRSAGSSVAAASTRTSVRDDFSDGEIQETTDVKLSDSQKRAIRIKKLRPDLVNSIKQAIGVNAAVKIGGYTSKGSMERDLQARERAMTKRTSKT